MMATIYWLGLFLCIVVVCMILPIYAFLTRQADKGDIIYFILLVVVFIGLAIPFFGAVIHKNDPVKLTITSTDGTVTVYETKRYLISDHDNYYRIYNQNDDSWIEHHEIKHTKMEYLEK